MTLLLSVKIFSLIVLIALSAFFSGTETALTSLSRIKLERLNKVKPGRLRFWEEEPHRVLACLLLGNNMTITAIGVLSASIALDMAHIGFGTPGRILLICSFVASTGLFVFGEVVPKIYARMTSDAWALSTAPAMFLFYRLTAIIAETLTWFSQKIISLFHVRGATPAPFMSSDQIRDLLSESHIPPPSRLLLNRILDFGRTRAQQVMIPGPEIFAIDLNRKKEDVITAIVASGYSRVPAYRGSLDNVEGIIYSRDLLATVARGDLFVLEDILRPAMKLPVDTPLTSALREFKQGRNHLALIVDASGRVKGLLTNQDVLEAIAGKK